MSGSDSFGNIVSELRDHKWFYENAWDIGEKHAHEVRRQRLSGFGLYDMHGDVSEWFSDWYVGDYYASSPAEDSEGASRVLRGGSWYNDAIVVRSRVRGRLTSSFRSHSIGFRVVCECVSYQTSSENRRAVSAVLRKI